MGSVVFFAVAPGVVAGVIPGWLTGWWDGGDAPAYLVPARIVVQALLLARPVLLVYAAVAAAAMVSFVSWYEEPALTRQHGEAYDAYRQAVPGWLPRLRQPTV